MIADGSSGRLAICPSCGYPKFGPGLCAFCVPIGTAALGVEAPRPSHAVTPIEGGTLADPAA
jgi:hypothetical protein